MVPLELIWLFSRPEEYHGSPDSIHALLSRLVSTSELKPGDAGNVPSLHTNNVLGTSTHKPA